MNQPVVSAKRKLPKWVLYGGGAVIALIVIARVGSGEPSGINMSTVTCENLIPHILEMSEDKDPQVLEISDPKIEISPPGNDQISCSGSAEWSRGSGFISYGAHVSNGGQVMLTYKQD